MTRLHQILIGVLVAQLVLVGVVFWPRSDTAGASGPLLFAAVKAEEISGLTISDKAGSSVRLVKQGDNWVVPDGGDFPADGSKIKTMVDKLVVLKGNRLVATTPASQAQLQVADDNFAARVEFQVGAAGHTLYLGSMSGGTATHVRVGGQDQIYLVDDLNTYDIRADVANWINAVYLTFSTADVTVVTIKNANGELTFNKDGQGTWSLQGQAAGETLNSNIESAVNNLSSLSMKRPLGKQAQPAYGMDRPNVVVTLKTNKDKQEKVFSLTIGALQKDNAYVAKSADSEYYVEVNDYSVKDIIERTRADYILQPTPEPGVAAPAATPATPGQ